ncbi:MAG: hypothetical protein ABI759_21705 [Candidatus Solibacter sp.]
MVLLANALASSAELTVGNITGNDNVGHHALVAGMARAVEQGENPLDFWSPENPFGSAIVRTYQPLAHALVVLAYYAMGKLVPLATVFLYVRYLAIVLLPLGFFACARLLAMSPLAAAAAAALAPLLSADAWYGLDYSSYVTTGRGLFPQSVAAILMLVAIGAGVRAIRGGRQIAVAGALVGLTTACHLIYGWIAAVTLCLAAILPESGCPFLRRFRRLTGIGALSVIVSAFQLLPILQDRAILNHSRWEESWKWDSFGAATVLKTLFSGEVLDHGRLPVMSLLALAGAATVAWQIYRTRRLPAPQGFLLAAAVVWILIFFGRPTWGPLLLAIGAVRDLHLHRAVGAVQAFLVLLAALAIEAGFRELMRRKLLWLASVSAVVLLAPMLTERAAYLARNQSQGTEVMIALNAAEPAVDAVTNSVLQTGGRVSAGPGTGWGSRFQVGNIPFFALLNIRLVPQMSAPYQLTALTSDLLPSFDHKRPPHYSLFNVRSVVVPQSLAAEAAPFLTPRYQVDRYRILDAPGRGYFDIVTTPAAATVDQADFYDVNRAWLESDWVDRHAHLWLDFDGRHAPPNLPRLAKHAALPPADSAAPPGELVGEVQSHERYLVEVRMQREGMVLFKMTWHPNWLALVDGKPQATAVLSPGFVGVPVASGSHNILMSYQPGFTKLWLALAGFLLAAGAVWAERRGYLNFPGAAPRGQ